MGFCQLMIGRPRRFLYVEHAWPHPRVDIECERIRILGAIEIEIRSSGLRLAMQPTKVSGVDMLPGVPDSRLMIRRVIIAILGGPTGIRTQDTRLKRPLL
jgi:hypothetical protein